MRRIISASLSPNSQADDVWLAMKTLFTPWKWRTGDEIAEAEAWFEKRFPGYSSVSFNSGRSAFFEILKAFGIGAGDEVMVQAFTCVAVPNGVLWAGAKPVYVDIDDSLNIDVRDAQKKLTERTRAIVVQHTFGVPADMDIITAFARRNKLLLIEDCAHGLGAMYKRKPVGSFGDASFFSFGRDKALSSVFGGMAIINSNLKSQISNLKISHDDLAYPSLFWIKQQLLHPIAFSVILPLYNLGIGKVILYLLQRLRLLSFPVYQEEKKGGKPSGFPRRYPNALAALLVHQLKKLDTYNVTRQHRAEEYKKILQDKKNVDILLYRDGAIFLRYPVLLKEPESIINIAKKKGILLGNWYHHVVDPKDVEYQSIVYDIGSCPRAEYAASHIINLPTLISSEDAKEVIRLLP